MPDTLALYENIWLCRNRLLTGILKLCKENVGRIPKIIGMDVVEMALWAQVLLLTSSLYVNAIVSTLGDFWVSALVRHVYFILLI